jgi:predicted nuclease of restriction endonuclease-like (RecB) superfamily
MDFKNLPEIINQLQEATQNRAVQSVNRMLTVRNWLIGYFIVEYEQNGEDRAEYGEKMLDNLSSELKDMKIKGMSATNLRLFRQFFFTYPQIHQTVSDEFSNSMQFNDLIQSNRIFQTASEEFEKYQTVSDKLSKSIINRELQSSDGLPAEVLLRHFSFSHLIELMKIEKQQEREFYEIEAMNGAWSVRQLKRQIESKLYERTGLSTNKDIVLQKANRENITRNIEDTIRNPYILEFTGLKDLPEYSESDLETSLLNHLQEFLVELGEGFCFEARQKRINIDNEHDRIDLVFYHRILKCHVIIDLKTRAFSHADAGQMNFYLNYYKENIIQKDDNLPVGIILCTDSNETKVRYSITGMDNKMFVSKYMIALPSEKELEMLIKREKEKYLRK